MELYVRRCPRNERDFHLIYTVRVLQFSHVHWVGHNSFRQQTPLDILWATRRFWRRTYNPCLAVCEFPMGWITKQAGRVQGLSND